MKEYLEFKNRQKFREWLILNCYDSKGVWLLFGKKGGPTTLSANDALEEALCFGWIDGVMKRIDEYSYIKYFSQRRKNSIWSDKNKKITERLIKDNLMQELGFNKINEAKDNGQWDKTNTVVVDNNSIEMLRELLKENKDVLNNFDNMPLSIQKTYTRAYLDAKTDNGKNNRLKWIIDRLEQNLKPT